MAIDPGWFVLAPLIPLFMALGPASFVIWLVRRQLRKQPLEAACRKAVARMPRRSFPSRANWVSNQGFAQSDAGLWIAVRSRGVESLTSKQGLKKSVFRKIPYLSDAPFRVSMPWRGWALLSSPALPDFTDDVDAVYHLTSTLAEVFEEVQFYSFNRPFNHHGWVWAKGGSIHRAYAWAGETLWNQGSVTEEELQLRMNIFDYGETPSISFTEPSLNFESIEAGDYFLDSPMRRKENSEKILLLAQLWSVDPRMVEETMVDDK